MPRHYTYCAFDSLWEEKSLVDSVDGVIWFNVTLSLQQDWSGVQSIISPEHCEPALFVTMDQGPACQETAGIKAALVTVVTDQSDEHEHHSPVDSGGSPVARQQGGVVDDGAVFGVVDDLHGDELGAEGQDVELSTSGLVLSHHLRDGLALHTPAGELEDGNAILLRFSCCLKKE